MNKNILNLLKHSETTKRVLNLQNSPLKYLKTYSNPYRLKTILSKPTVNKKLRILKILKTFETSQNPIEQPHRVETI
jgi:hypothetical protein